MRQSGKMLYDILKKITALALSAALISGLTACGDDDGFLSEDVKWVDSDLTDAISEDDEIRLQDDFAAAVNKEWKLENGFSDIMDEMYNKVLSNKKRIVTDGSIEGYEAELLRNYYELATDLKARDSDGMEPLRPYIDDIESARNMDELFDWMNDPKRNPLGIAPLFFRPENVFRSGKYDDKYAVYLTLPDLSMDGGYSSEHSHDLYYQLGIDPIEQFEQKKDTMDYFLRRLGYSGEDAQRIINACFSFERDMADADNPDLTKDEEEITYDREELLELAGDYPVDAYLSGIGFRDNDIFLLDPGYIKRLDDICGEDDLEKAKAFFIISYILKSYLYLDSEGIAQAEEFQKPRRLLEMDPESIGETEESKAEERIFDVYIGGTGMAGAMNHVYVEHFFDDSQIKELNDMTKDIIDGFRDIFDEEEWLSEEGKKKSKEKLDEISVHIAHQNFETADYNDMKLIKRSEGGNFLEAYYEASRFMNSHMAEVSMMKYDRNYWDPLDIELSTTLTNAMYNPTTNGIYIFAGVCEAPAYSPEMSYEEKLGGLFSIIGHEITHGFDNMGAQYNQYGENENWLPLEDQTEFNDLCDLVANYYSSLSPYESSGMYDGDRVNGEATADMGGIRVTLYLASKEEDFDYDAYFRAYARLWRTNIPMETEQMYFSEDVHPLSFFRINVGLQQFDEFYDTYDIQKTDGMYLDPEKRISVW